MAQVGTDITLLFEYVNDSGARYTPTPLPTVTATRFNDDLSTDTLASGVTATDTGITGIVGIVIAAASNTETGTVSGIAVTTDTNLLTILRTAYASEVVEPAVDLSAIEDALATLNATATITSPVRQVGGEYALDLVQGQTHSTATGNAIVMTFTGVPDVTGGTALLSLAKSNGKLITATSLTNPIGGSMGTWSGGSVTVTWEMTDDQTALLPASRNDDTDLVNSKLRFEVTLTTAGGETVTPVTPTVGDLSVFAQVWTS